jgi:steroid delta-isomerase-like uncharacterized protein
MSDTDRNKQIIQKFIQTVWRDRNLAALKDFWTEDCINHAMPSGKNNRGLDRLQSYHKQFFADFSAFSDIHIEIVQQIAEGDRVVTYLNSRGKHTGTFLGIPTTGKSISMSAIRIDRFRDEKIAEHWSISDLAGLMQQLQN